VSDRANKILQFGTGRFVRGFFDPMVKPERSVTVIQSRPNASGANDINLAKQGYHVWVRGIEDGQTIERLEVIRSLGQGLSASSQWQEVLALASDPAYSLIVSNTTEKGLILDPQDNGSTNWMQVAPASFPARVLAWLFHRYSMIGTGITLLPLELIEFNAVLLRDLVLQQAKLWEKTNAQAFINWLENDCRWLSTLVDRICVDPVEPFAWTVSDPLAVMTEPFQMLAISDDGGDRSVIPDHPSVIWAKDMRPYFLQKVRLLNGLHTAMVAKCLPLGFEYVIDVMNDAEQSQWLLRILNEEMVPTLEAQGLQVRGFADAVIDRFRNPFFRHRLSDIAFGHETKIQVRLVPTIEEFKQVFGKTPPLLEAVLGMPMPVLGA